MEERFGRKANTWYPSTQTLCKVNSSWLNDFWWLEMDEEKGVVCVYIYILPSMQIRNSIIDPGFKAALPANRAAAFDPMKFLPLSWFCLHNIFSLPPLPTSLSMSFYSVRQNPEILKCGLGIKAARKLREQVKTIFLTHGFFPGNIALTIDR